MVRIFLSGVLLCGFMSDVYAGSSEMQPKGGTHGAMEALLSSASLNMSGAPREMIWAPAEDVKLSTLFEKVGDQTYAQKREFEAGERKKRHKEASAARKALRAAILPPAFSFNQEDEAAFQNYVDAWFQKVEAGLKEKYGLDFILKPELSFDQSFQDRENELENFYFSVAEALIKKDREAAEKAKRLAEEQAIKAQLRAQYPDLDEDELDEAAALVELGIEFDPLMLEDDGDSPSYLGGGTYDDDDPFGERGMLTFGEYGNDDSGEGQPVFQGFPRLPNEGTSSGNDTPWYMRSDAGNRNWP